jgi:branched-chain amino acid transport system ATP-binding protein
VQEIFGVIATARCEGTTVLLIEKNAFSALGIANNHYVLTNGRILLSRPCKALLSDDAAQAVYLEVWAGRGDAEPRGSPDFEGRN